MDGSLTLSKTLVVLVDDDRQWLVRMKKLIKLRGSPSIDAESPYEAISFVKNGLERPAIFMIRDDMREFDYPGIRLIEHLNKIKVYPLLSILVTDQTDRELCGQALDNGALWCISKDMTDELIMKFIARGERLIGDDLTRAERLDPLTGKYGVYDREGGMRKFRHVWMEARKNRTPTSFVFVDVNGLGEVNEKYGKTVGYGPGDEVVKAEARLLHAHRSSDILVRFGGDEFILILPATPERKAKEVLSRLKREAPRAVIELVPGDYFQLTLSGGVSGVKPKYLGDDPDALYLKLSELAQIAERLDKPEARKQRLALTRREDRR